MKAKHIKKLRKEIKHYYIAKFDDRAYGFIKPCKPDFMKTCPVAYGRNERDAINRYIHLFDSECGRTTWEYARWALMSTDVPANPKFITYWR
jgi:hypothetical protein